ncbi:11785_t:CDS:2 [Scutellospora calospora]|uniref:11785_t:CDS:1 n=1 Tax=Scutellospora calospora TaxID=85575 RepID=A0ACA9K8X7_9GLOM|nr:11785_t:CDS:2 [Scutellospora calospora]
MSQINYAKEFDEIEYDELMTSNVDSTELVADLVKEQNYENSKDVSDSLNSEDKIDEEVSKNLNNTESEVEILPIALLVDDFVPEALLDIKYGEKNVEVGNKFTIKETENAPDVKFVLGDSDSNKKFTLLMVDPDAPSRDNPIKGEWRHWVVGNIPSDGRLTDATIVDSYQGPSPPPGTNEHRYVFLLYEQQVPCIEFQLLDGTKRANFKARQFAKQYELKLISANYFKCKFN